MSTQHTTVEHTSEWKRIGTAALIFFSIFAIAKFLNSQNLFEMAATVIVVMVMHLATNWVPRTKLDASTATSGLGRVMATAQEESTFIAMWTGQGSRLGEAIKGLFKGVVVVAGKMLLVAGSAFFVSYWLAGGMAALFVAWLILPNLFRGFAEKLLKVKETSTTSPTSKKDS